MRKLIAMLLALICLCPAALAELSIPMVGAEAPDFEIELLNGETFRLSEQRGKAVLINIWASWCGPCVSEMPDIDQLAQDYAEDLVVIGVNCGEDEQTVADFVEEQGFGYLFAADPEYRISGQIYFTNTLPYTIVVDPYGRISTLHHGGGMGMYEILEGYVQEALEAENPSGVVILA